MSFIDFNKKDMGIDENVWFDSSFFYTMDKWHLLLKELNLFILQLDNSDYLHFTLSLNRLPTHNIEFALLFKNELDMDKTGLCFFNDFTNIKELLSQKEYVIEVNGIGLPYPKNTFHIGLNPIPYNKELIPLYSIRHNFSKLMLNVLKEEEIDTNTLQSLIVYAVLTLGKSLIKFDPELAKNTFANYRRKPYLEKSLTSEYEEILDLAQSLIYRTNLDESEIWLQDWHTFCQKGVRYGLSSKNEMNVMSKWTNGLYINAINCMTQQLAIVSESIHELLVLINTVLLECSTNSENHIH